MSVMKEGWIKLLAYDGTRPYMTGKQAWKGGEIVGREREEE